MPPALRPVQRRSGAGAPGLFHRTPGAVFEEASVRARALAHRHPRPPPATGGLHERGAEPFGRPQPFPPSGARQKDDEIRGRGARHVIHVARAGAQRGEGRAERLSRKTAREIRREHYDRQRPPRALGAPGLEPLRLLKGGRGDPIPRPLRFGRDAPLLAEDRLAQPPPRLVQQIA